MKNEFISEYRVLKRSGWDVSKTPAIRFNGGSESLGHVVAKTVSAKLYQEHGWQTDTEVSHDEYGEIDVLAYAPDKLTYAVELENDITEDTKQDKLQRYVESNVVIDDMQIIEVGELPANVLDMRDRLMTQLALY